MKYLIAGLGSIGRRHLRNLMSLGERDIMLYRTHTSTLDDEELEGFPVERDLTSALARKPDAVIVSNPTSIHIDVAIPCAEAGCHILLEKPVSHSMEGVDELIAAVKSSGVQVLVGYQFRFHPGLQKVHSLLSAGEIGRPLSVRAHWGEYLPDWHPWEDYRQGYSARSEMGGGVILTLSHPLDYLRWLLGEVKSTWAFAGQMSDLELNVEDTAEIGMLFENKTIGSLHLDYNQRPSTHRLEIIGTQGTIRWDNNDEESLVQIYRVGENLWETSPTPTEFQRNDLFLAEMRHFQEVVQEGVQPVCTLKDGIQALRLSLAALHSSNSGQLININN